MKTITINLTGLLQSWGNQADFNYRTTYKTPTKSGVLGMVAAAKGMKRDNPRIPALNNLAFATRTDFPGKPKTDFQIVEYQKTKTKKARQITRRDYLQDAVFVAAIGGNKKDINQIIYNLKHPKFTLYLGRKCNVPFGPFKIQEFENTNPLEALNQLPWQANQHQQKQFYSNYHATILADADLMPHGHVFMRKDAIGSFNPKHRYSSYRPVVRTQKIFKVEKKVNNRVSDEFFDVV